MAVFTVLQFPLKPHSSSLRNSKRRLACRCPGLGFEHQDFQISSVLTSLVTSVITFFVSLGVIYVGHTAEEVCSKPCTTKTAVTLSVAGVPQRPSAKLRQRTHTSTPPHPTLPSHACTQLRPSSSFYTLKRRDRRQGVVFSTPSSSGGFEFDSQPRAGCPDRVFSWFYSVSPGVCWDTVFKI